MTRLRIRGGRIIDPAAGMDGTGDLCIADGKVVAAGKVPRGFDADRELDASGCWVLPGVVDLCARFREPGQGTLINIASEAGAAASAGVTTVCCPPDTQPPVDTPAVVELIQRRVAACGGIRICVTGALTRALDGEQLGEMHALAAAGCVGVGNAFRPLASNEVLRRALEYAAGCDLTVFIRPEDAALQNGGVINEGAVSTRLGLPPVPESAETIAVSTALLLAAQTGARIHLERLSCAASVAMVAEAKQRGLPVSADTGICHLFLTEDDVAGYDANLHLRPPLRRAGDREVLRRSVADGVLDAVCSDHYPHDEDAKSAPFVETAPGASTLEVLLPLLAGLAIDDVIPVSRVVAALTSGPARVLRQTGLGSLVVGNPADVVVFDPARPWKASAATLESAGRNCPFLGHTLAGRARYTLYAGGIVYPREP